MTSCYQQEQQALGVTVLQIHPGSLASANGSLRVGDVIDKVCNIVTLTILTVVMTTDQ